MKYVSCVTPNPQIDFSEGVTTILTLRGQAKCTAGGVRYINKRPQSRQPIPPAALSGLVTGYHLVTVGDTWTLVLPVYDNRPVQRKITGYEVHETESGEQAAALMQRIVIREGCWRHPLVLHVDNGAAMKSQTLQMKLHELNITQSHSRPWVSNDNASVPDAKVCTTVAVIGVQNAVGCPSVGE